MTESMFYYVSKIRNANTPLEILLNMDFFTDLIEKEMKNEKRKVKNNNRK